MVCFAPSLWNKLGFAAGREDHWHRSCLEFLSVSAWELFDPTWLGTGWAPPPHAYSSTNEDVWDAAFHPQFLCPLPMWGPLGTSTPTTLKRSNAWDPPDIHTPGSDSLRLPSAAREKGQAGGNTQGTPENPSHSATVPGASVAAKARGPRIHASTEAGGGCLPGLCVCKCIWWPVFVDDVIDPSNLCWSPNPHLTVFGDGPPRR